LLQNSSRGKKETSVLLLLLLLLLFSKAINTSRKEGQGREGKGREVFLFTSLQ